MQKPGNFLVFVLITLLALVVVFMFNSPTFFESRADTLARLERQEVVACMDIDTRKGARARCAAARKALARFKAKQ